MLRQILFISLLLATRFPVFAQKELPVGMKAPVIQFQKSYPPNYHLPKNKPIILDFWAAWCAPCVAGLIENNKLVSAYSDRIEFIAITDTTSKKVEEFISSRNFKHHFIVDKDTQTFSAFGVSAIPYAFIIDTSGVIQWRGYGRDIDESLLNEFLQKGRVVEKKEPVKLFSFNDTAAASKILHLVVADKKVLRKHRTILKAKVENQLGQFSNSPKREGKLTVINYTLKELAERINPFFSNLKLQVAEDSSVGYDFIDLPFDNFDSLNHFLRKHYGICFR